MSSQNPDKADGTSSIQLYLDHHIKHQLAVDLRDRGIDVLLSQEAGNEEATDEAQLEFAAAQGRVLITFNIGDFAKLHQMWIASAREHSGIVVSRQLGAKQYGTLLDRVSRLVECSTVEALRNQFLHLEQFKR